MPQHTSSHYQLKPEDHPLLVDECLGKPSDRREPVRLEPVLAGAGTGAIVWRVGTRWRVIEI